MTAGTPLATLAMFNIDCAHPGALADFYSAVLGWDVTYRDDNYAMVSDGKTSIGFGRVEGYAPPPWPDPSATKRHHLDLSVADLAQAEAACTGLGANIPEFQPGGERWRVLIDPDGHPFCLCQAQPS